MTREHDATGPQPTRDLAQLERDLDRYGCALMAEALTPEQTRALRERLLEQAAAELAQGLAFEDGGATQRLVDDFGRVRVDAFSAANGGVNQRVWMLVNKGRVFRELVLHPDVSKLLAHVLGREYLLSQMSANIAKPGGVAMGLHTDQWWMPAPSRPDEPPVRAGSLSRSDFGRDNEHAAVVQIQPPVVCNVMYMLNDFTADNGGTRYVPGSHLTGRQPYACDGLEPRAARGPAGTALLFDGRVWHGTGANTSEDVRLGLLATYCAPQFRTQENYTLGILPEVFADCSPELKRRLGFGIWNAYGRVGSPAAGMAEPTAEAVGELRPPERAD